MQFTLNASTLNAIYFTCNFHSMQVLFLHHGSSDKKAWICNEKKSGIGKELM